MNDDRTPTPDAPRAAEIRQFRFRRFVLGGFAVLLPIVVTVSTVAFISIFEDDLEEGWQAHAVAMARDLASARSPDGLASDPGFADDARRIVARPALEITAVRVLDPSGRMRFTTERGVPAVVAAEALQGARAGRIASGLVDLNEDVEPPTGQLETCVPISEGGIVRAVIAVRRDAGSLLRQRASLRDWAVGGSVAILTLLFAATYLVMVGAARGVDTERAKHLRFEDALEEEVRARTRALQAEHARLQTLIDGHPSGFLLVDAALNVMLVSRALLGIARADATEIVGMRCADLSSRLPMLDPEVIRRAAESGMEVTIDRAVGAPGDDRAIWEQRCIPTEQDEQRWVIVILTEATNERMLHARLVRTERAAAMADAARGVAHSFRNAMTSFRMVMQVLAETLVDDRSIAVALRSLSRMEELVSALLKFTRPPTAQFKRTSIDRVVDESLLFVKHLAAEGGIALECRIAPDLPELDIDESLIQEAVVNALVNACQAMREGGSIVLGASRMRSDRLGDVVSIEVRDSGPGMSEEVAARATEPFFTTRAKGTGLGLAIVRRIMEDHHGELKLHSRAGGGTTVQLLLRVPAES